MDEPMPRRTVQQDLFQPSGLPQGLAYVENLLSAAEEMRLIGDLKPLPFKEFEFHGFLGRRRVVSFGWRYDFSGGGLQKAGDVPPFLWPLREKVAHFASLVAADLQHVLITEYPASATIGWHKDRPAFGDVMGVSLASECTFRFRRKDGSRWQRAALILKPRSAYVLRGPARSEWEHSIPAVDRLRYSITFRTLARNVTARAGRQGPHPA